MKYILYSLITFLILNSCASPIHLTQIDVLEPAIVTFPPEITNVLIVDNSPTLAEGEETEMKKDEQSVISLDSARTILLGSLVQFMNEEQYFNKVDIYQYKTNHTKILKDVNPLSRRKVQSICREMKADALISLDLFVVSAQIESENTAYFTDYSIIGAKMGAILRVFSNEGDLYHSRIGYVDSLFREGPAPWDMRRNYTSEVNTLITDLSIVGADKMTGMFIPSWKTHQRWYYTNNSSEMQQAANFVKKGEWKNTIAIWEPLYEKENKSDKKAKLASNIALAYECLDNIDKAYEWISVAFGLLPPKNKNLSLQIALYKTELGKRKNNVHKLEEQLGISDTVEGIAK